MSLPSHGIHVAPPDVSNPRVDSLRETRHPPQATSPAPMLAPELARAVAAQRDRLDLDLVSRAYRVSAQAHRGQKRESGDDYVSHSVAVATILAEQQDRKSTRLNSSHGYISYAVFCLK